MTNEGSHNIGLIPTTGYLEKRLKRKKGGKKEKRLREKKGEKGKMLF